MRNLIIALTLMFCCIACRNESSRTTLGFAAVDASMDTIPLKEKPVMYFGKDTVFDFGTIKEGQIVAHNFKFTNSGCSLLTIQEASGSCGCTMPDYPRKPIPPGSQGMIKVSFNAAHKMGKQLKSVMIYSNARNTPVRLLIKASIVLN